MSKSNGNHAAQKPPPRRASRKRKERGNPAELPPSVRPPEQDEIYAIYEDWSRGHLTRAELRRALRNL